jgi:hypothetical protein
MNFCAFGGHVVEGNSPLPADPVDHDVERLPIHGCNRLRCSQCKARVRSAAKLEFRDSLARVDLNQLYEVADPAASPLLEPRFGVRLYLCRCTRWSESIGGRAVGGPDLETPLRVPLPQGTAAVTRAGGTVDQPDPPAAAGSTRPIQRGRMHFVMRKRSRRLYLRQFTTGSEAAP